MKESFKHMPPKKLKDLGEDGLYALKVVKRLREVVSKAEEPYMELSYIEAVNQIEEILKEGYGYFVGKMGRGDSPPYRDKPNIFSRPVFLVIQAKRQYEEQSSIITTLWSHVKAVIQDLVQHTTVDESFTRMPGKSKDEIKAAFYDTSIDKDVIDFLVDNDFIFGYSFTSNQFSTSIGSPPTTIFIFRKDFDEYRKTMVLEISHNNTVDEVIDEYNEKIKLYKTNKSYKTNEDFTHLKPKTAEELNDAAKNLDFSPLLTQILNYLAPTWKIHTARKEDETLWGFLRVTYKDTQLEFTDRKEYNDVLVWIKTESLDFTRKKEISTFEEFENIMKHNLDESFTHLKPKSKQEIKDAIIATVSGTAEFNVLIQLAADEYDIRAYKYKSMLTSEPIGPVFSFKNNNKRFFIFQPYFNLTWYTNENLSAEKIYIKNVPTKDTRWSEFTEISSFEELKAYVNKNTINESYITQVKHTELDKEPISIYVNPTKEELKDTQPMTRALADIDGNLFITNKLMSWTHFNLANELKSKNLISFPIGINNIYDEQLDDKFLLLYYLGENTFALSDSNEKTTTLELIKIAQNKNPQFKFYNQYYYTVLKLMKESFTHLKPKSEEEINIVFKRNSQIFQDIFNLITKKYKIELANEETNRSYASVTFKNGEEEIKIIDRNDGVSVGISNVYDFKFRVQKTVTSVKQFEKFLSKNILDESFTHLKPKSEEEINTAVEKITKDFHKFTMEDFYLFWEQSVEIQPEVIEKMPLIFKCMDVLRSERNYALWDGGVLGTDQIRFHFANYKGIGIWMQQNINDNFIKIDFFDDNKEYKIKSVDELLNFIDKVEARNSSDSIGIKTNEDFTYLKPKTDEEMSQALKQMCSSKNKGHVNLDSLEQLPEGTTFSNGGNVDLRSLKQLPEGTIFSNGGDVYLRSLEQLPEGTTFSNEESVYIRLLKQLPEGTSFSNRGNVYLDSLEQLPKGTTFSNGGHVRLSSLKQLPEGTTFSNGEGVYMRSLEQLPKDFVYTGMDYVYTRNNKIKGPIGVKRTDEGFTHLKPKSKEEIKTTLLEIVKGYKKFSEILEKILDNYDVQSVWIMTNMYGNSEGPAVHFDSANHSFQLFMGYIINPTDEDILYLRYHEKDEYLFAKEMLEINSFEDIKDIVDNMESSWNETYNVNESFKYLKSKSDKEIYNNIRDLSDEELAKIWANTEQDYIEDECLKEFERREKLYKFTPKHLFDIRGTAWYKMRYKDENSNESFTHLKPKSEKEIDDTIEKMLQELKVSTHAKNIMRQVIKKYTLISTYADNTMISFKVKNNINEHCYFGLYECERSNEKILRCNWSSNLIGTGNILIRTFEELEQVIQDVLTREAKITESFTHLKPKSPNEINKNIKYLTDEQLFDIWSDDNEVLSKKSVKELEKREKLYNFTPKYLNIIRDTQWYTEYQKNESFTYLKPKSNVEIDDAIEKKISETNLSLHTKDVIRQAVKKYNMTSIGNVSTFKVQYPDSNKTLYFGLAERPFNLIKLNWIDKNARVMSLRIKTFEELEHEITKLLTKN